ncbi:cell division topological specificity factor MinE [Faecalimonas sp.]
MNVFESGQKRNSVVIAKDRLKVLLISDRVNCTPDTFEKLQNELYLTVSKYIEVSPEVFDVEITKSNISIKLAGECN